MISLKRLTAAAATCAVLTTSAYAAPMSKNETVYVNLKSDGGIERAIVVNEFNLSGQDSVIDYGDYSSVKNLSSDEKPSVKNGCIKWKVDPSAQQFYYQGELKKAELAWDFSFDYTLDGKKVTAEQLAGKSGNISINIRADKNPDADSYFAENYLAQISLTLDSDKCENIVCEDAIISNVGSNKTLTFMVLPKLSKEYTVTFSAKDFEYDGITIGLVKVSDGILTSVDSVKSEISSIGGSISSLVSGSGELLGGAQSLSQGLTMLDRSAQSLSQIRPMLTSAVNSIDNGIGQLASSSEQLSQGSGEIRSALMQLDSKSYDISKGIGTVSDALSTMTKDKSKAEAGAKQIKQARNSAAELKSGVKTLKDGYKQIESGLSTMADNADAISGGISTLGASKSQIDYLTNSGSTLSAQINAVLGSLTDEQKAQMGQLVGLLQMSAQYAQASSGALTQLYDSADTFAEAAQQLVSGAQTMNSNMQTLNSGFNTLESGVGQLDKVFDAADSFADSTLALINGAQKLKSGVSELDAGFGEYSRGVGQVAENYITLDNGLFQLAGGIGTLSNGFSELTGASDGVFSSLDELSDSISTLNNGAAQLLGGTETLDSGVSTIGSVLGGVDITSLIGMTENAETVSFAAPGIVSPDSVVFIIKSPSVTVDDDAKDDSASQKKGFFQKLIALFTGDK